MSLQVEKLEKNMAKLTIEVSADELEKALQNAYKKQKNKISMPGFRKGKVPRQMVEKMYGADVFYEDAANALIPQAYSEAYDECDLQIVSQPEIDITQIEKGKPFMLFHWEARAVMFIVLIWLLDREIFQIMELANRGKRFSR